jgi:hypothetical protein
MRSGGPDGGIFFGGWFAKAPFLIFTTDASDEVFFSQSPNESASSRLEAKTDDELLV